MVLPAALIDALNFKRESEAVTLHSPPQLTITISPESVSLDYLCFSDTWIDEAESETLPIQDVAQAPPVPVPGKPSLAYKTLVIRATTGFTRFKIFIRLEGALTPAGRAIGRALCPVYLGQGPVIDFLCEAWLPNPSSSMPHLKVD
eukprot:m.919867 g.919867  ORF g.919867 m.919867 type:complete len:146 (-) comp60339_c0_seq1:48-485(-)